MDDATKTPNVMVIAKGDVVKLSSLQHKARMYIGLWTVMQQLPIRHDTTDNLRGHEWKVESLALDSTSNSDTTEKSVSERSHLSSSHFLSTGYTIFYYQLHVLELSLIPWPSLSLN